MAAGAWDFAVGTTAAAIAASFSQEAAKEQRNPYETRGNRPLTPEERAEAERAAKAIADVEQRVRERRFHQGRI